MSLLLVHGKNGHDIWSVQVSSVEETKVGLGSRPACPSLPMASLLYSLKRSKRSSMSGLSRILLNNGIEIVFRMVGAPGAPGLRSCNIALSTRRGSQQPNHRMLGLGPQSWR
jgi:hypothetical protein